MSNDDDPTECAPERRRKDRGHISIRGASYYRLMEYAKQHGKSASSLVEEWIEKALEKEGSP